MSGETRKNLNNELDFEEVVLNTQKEADEKLMLLEGWVPKEKEEEVNTYLEKENIYYGIGTRNGQTLNGTRGGKENIVAVPCLWTDIDFKSTPRKLAAARLKKFSFQPSVIVRSGGGIHCYFYLKEPAEKAATKNIEEANRREKRAVKFYGQALRQAPEKEIKDFFNAVMQIESDHITLTQQ